MKKRVLQRGRKCHWIEDMTAGGSGERGVRKKKPVRRRAEWQKIRVLVYIFGAGTMAARSPCTDSDSVLKEIEERRRWGQGKIQFERFRAPGVNDVFKQGTCGRRKRQADTSSHVRPLTRRNLGVSRKVPFPSLLITPRPAPRAPRHRTKIYR